jgi:flagellar biosynthesis/type III secretory pathway protein FliH
MRRLPAESLSANATPARLGTASPAAAPAPAVDPAADLRAQAERELAAAREQGLANGLKDAEAEVARRVEAIAVRMRTEHDAALAAARSEQARFAALAASVQGELDAYAKDAEAVAIEVAYAAVVRLLGERVAQREHIADLCKAVLHDYGAPHATLRLSEADLVHLPKEGLEVAVEADRRLVPGQCVIATVRGQFESGLDVRLERLRRSLLDALATPGGAA